MGPGESGLRKGSSLVETVENAPELPGRASGKAISVGAGGSVFHSLGGLESGVIMRLCDIVISVTRWQSLEGLRQPILADEGFSFAFRIRSGEQSSRRCGESMS
jgi:hypothetical protein